MGKRSKKQVGAILHSRGVTFRVWAPFADKVAVSGSFNDWGETPMTNEQDGYWTVQIPHVGAGHEYQFIINNGSARYERNDPRALQLTASGGTSIIVDPTFDWGDDDYLPPPRERQIIYELHVGSFHRPDASTEGTFRDVLEKLDHLVALGVNMIELMPIGSMLHDHGWGYAPDYIYAVESAYGGRHGLLEFVRAAHARGIGVMLDVVYNHLGPDDDMDLWRFDGWYENDGGGIYFYNDWRGETPWGVRPDFGRFEVRQYLLDNVRYWLYDCRLDGLRVDSTLYTRNVYGRHNDPSTDLPEAWTLLQKINSISHKIKPSAMIVGEDVAENEYITKPINQGGAGFDSQWQVTMPHVFRQALCPGSTGDIELSGLLGELTRTYNNDAFQRIIYSDSHDSAANGAARLNEEIDPGKPQSPHSLAKSLLAAGIVMSAPGVPMILMGQEFAQGGSFSDWHQLDWELADKYGGIVLAHRHLIDLRRNAHGHTAGLLGSGMSLSHVDENNKVIAYHRWDKGGPKDDVMVLINFGLKSHAEYVLGWPRNGIWKVRFNSTWKGYNPDFKEVDVADVTVDSGEGTVILPPHSLLIFSQDR